MNAATITRECQEQPGTKPIRSPRTPEVREEQKVLPVIPLMSKEEGERLISQMPQRSLQEAREMTERMLGRL